MKHKVWFGTVAIVMIVAMVLAACAPQTIEVTREVQKEVTKEVTKVVEKEVIKEVTPTPEPLDAISQIDPTGQEIVFWHVSTKKHEEVLLEMIDEFNATNEWGIKVIPEYGGYYGDIYKKIMAALAAGEPPDLAVAYPNQAADYALNGDVVALDDYVASAKYGLTEADLQDIFPAFLAGDRNPYYDNKLMSFPPNRSMEVMYYNKTLLEQAGYDHPPATWAEFEEMSKAVAALGGDVLGGYAYMGGASNFATFVWSRGGDIIKDGKAVFNGPKAVEAMTMIQRMFQEGTAYQPAEKYGDQTDVSSNKAAFAFGSTAGLKYWVSAFESNAPDSEWGIAVPPHDTSEPVVDLYGPSVCVFKTTPERQLAAWLFIKWFTDTEQTARWAKDSSYFPVRASAAAEMTDYFASKPLYAKAWSWVKYGRTEPNIPGWQEVRGIIGNAMTEIINGADVQATLDKAVEEANTALSSQ
ncbi:MAG TPA: ABC transporter substrate-binding protein [Anaerolineae bacterium]|nr:ABC transporter substrate-binding protein [Anaerolineae bacterium]